MRITEVNRSGVKHIDVSTSRGVYVGSFKVKFIPNQKEIIKKYHLKKITFNREIDEVSRFLFLLKISHQLEVLAKIRGDNNLGKGVLKINCASLNKSEFPHFRHATYEIYLLREKIADLNQSDGIYFDDSFLHEFAHFIDYYAGQKNKKSPYNFASGQEKMTPFCEVLNKIGRDNRYVSALEKLPNSSYAMLSNEVYARFFEVAISYYARKKYPAYASYFGTKKFTDSQYLPKANIDGLYRYAIQSLRDFDK